jgi:peptide deformylase
MDIIYDVEQLSKIADEVDVRKDNQSVRDIVVSLKKTVREHGLTSLTAPQIGINKRIFVINFNGDIRTFINPMITSVKGLELSRETCSSIPGREFIRIRHNNIRVMYTTPLGKIEHKPFLGAAAMVFQHCVDHLDGLLISDVGLEVDEMYDNATDEERQEVINMYLDSLDVRNKEISKEIQEDKELKKIFEGIEFMEKVWKGEIQVESVPINVPDEDDEVETSKDDTPDESQ